jgi:phage N-6-adenine-methyltransferase
MAHRKANGPNAKQVLRAADRISNQRQQPSVHFSSKTDLWATPPEFFARLDAEFHFETDVCALPENAKCRRYFTPSVDGLKQKWEGVVYSNPPYGRRLPKWVKKAYESALLGATVVCLLPARTDTAWWHDYVMKASEIRLIRGRLKFGGAKNSAPFPSAVVVFRPESARGVRLLAS